FRRRVELPETAGGSVSGQLSGGASRLTAYLLDLAIVSVLGTIVIWVTRFMISVFTSHDLQLTDASGVWYAVGDAALFGVYMWILLVLFGRTGGMAFVGVRVTADDESPLGVGATTVRVLVYPFSFILGLGLVGIVIGRRHRALHDVAAHSVVRYDWGDRAAEMPAPLTQLLTDRGVL